MHSSDPFNIMATDTTISNKRRRTNGALHDGSDTTICCLTTLPAEPLTHISSFLAAPSRALFASAVAGPQHDEIFPNERCTAIVAQLDVLNFEEIEKDLAARLTDDDIKSALICIESAQHKLKRLMLTNCTKITGIALEPLRNSSVIEQIDMSSMAEHEDRSLLSVTLHTPISFDDVLPILDSIVATEGFSLKYLVFPKAWCDYRSRSLNMSELHQFIMRYNEMRGNTMDCGVCSQSILQDGSCLDIRSYSFGVQSKTCYACLRHYCSRIACCMDKFIGFCQNCEKGFCSDCLCHRSYSTDHCKDHLLQLIWDSQLYGCLKSWTRLGYVRT